MKRSSAVCLLAVFLVLCLSATAAQQAAKEKVIVGVLKDDGTIMPFARYDGLHWSTWDDPPMDPATLPTTPPLRQIPKEWRVPSTWRLWLPSGSTHQIHVTGLQYHKTDCSESDWGFGTDFPKALNISQNACPDTVIGLALSTDLPLQQFRRTDPKEGIAFPSALLNRAFTQAQAVESRKRGAIRVEQAWRVDFAYQTLYYIEATKRYGCDCFSDCFFPFFQGWVFYAPGGGNQKVLSSTLQADMDCDFKSATFTSPMGLIQLKSGNYVIVGHGDWENAWYGILKIQSGSVTVVIK